MTSRSTNRLTSIRGVVSAVKAYIKIVPIGDEIGEIWGMPTPSGSFSCTCWSLSVTSWRAW